MIARARGRYDASPGVIDVTIDPPVRRDAASTPRCASATPAAARSCSSGMLTPFGNVQLNGKKLDIALTTLWYAHGRQSWLLGAGGDHPARRPRAHRRRSGRSGSPGCCCCAAIGLAVVTAIRENTP